jgi:hypothetical protein
VHERVSAGTPGTALNSDPAIHAMTWLTPVRWAPTGELFWVDPAGVAPPFTEEGYVADCQFKRIRGADDEPEWVRVAAPKPQ